MIVIEESDKLRTFDRRVKLICKQTQEQKRFLIVCSIFLVFICFFFQLLYVKPPKARKSLFASQSFEKRGPRIFIRSHELSNTGAPRVCSELALLLGEYLDANVVFSIPESFMTRNDASIQISRLIPRINFTVDLSGAVESALDADIVIVSTAAPNQLEWMHLFRKASPSFPALIWWIHEGQSVMHEWPEAHTSRISNEMSSGIANLIIFPSSSTQLWWLKEIEARSKTTMVSKILALPWGLPSWRFSSLQSSESLSSGVVLRSSLGIKPDNFVFLVVGSYNRLKGHRGIAKAFRLAQKECEGGSTFHLVTVGVGLGASDNFFPQSDVQWVKEDPTIHLLGESDSIPSFLSMANVYVSNTLDGGETWGLANLEALASGVPILASDVGGASEMLKNNSLALFHSVPSKMDDSEADKLSENMCLLWKDVNLRKTLVQEGQKYADRFNQDYLKKSIKSIIEINL